MSYKSISPQLKSSCYNCSYFQPGPDMLNGLCYHASEQAGIETAGIGTCGQFTMKRIAEDSVRSRRRNNAGDCGQLTRR